jgi:hypothetical protein
MMSKFLDILEKNKSATLSGNILTSNNIPFGVMSGFIISTDQSVMSLLFKTYYRLRAVV